MRDPKERYIKNDFAPGVRNEYFSLATLFLAMRTGAVKEENIPEYCKADLRKHIDERLKIENP